MIRQLVVMMFLLTVSVATAAEPNTLVRFLATGDYPYAKGEYSLMEKQMEQMPTEGVAFAVHVGDIKPGSWACDETIYEQVSEIMKGSKVPLFALVGDNEWNDCKNPEEAWMLWEKYFKRFEQNWSHNLAVYHSMKRDENISFVHNNVLFIGLNLVGGTVYKDEWKTRLKQNVKWVEKNLKRFGKDVSSMVLMGHAQINGNHDDFMKPFNKLAKKFEKPILYIQGDGHRWIEDRPFEAKNILRVQVDQGGIAPPVLVSVTDDEEEPFVFDRRLEEPKRIVIKVDADKKLEVDGQEVTFGKLLEAIPEGTEGQMVWIEYAEEVPGKFVNKIYGELKANRGVMVRREVLKSN